MPYIASCNKCVHYKIKRWEGNLPKEERTYICYRVGILSGLLRFVNRLLDNPALNGCEDLIFQGALSNRYVYLDREELEKEGLMLEESVKNIKNKFKLEGRCCEEFKEVDIYERFRLLENAIDLPYVTTIAHHRMNEG